MGKQSLAAFVMSLLASAAGGCSEPELPGDYWQVELTGSENSCTGGGASYTAEYEYRVQFTGNSITLAIGPDTWATGIAEGCSLNYTSALWTDLRDDFEIEWEILGSSIVNLENGSCVDGSDWQGTETFVVATSAHPDVQPGCTYTLDVTGTYLKSVEE